MAIRSVLLLLMLVATASADAPTLNGFVTSGNGELQGNVTDDDGAPVVDAIVHVVSSSGDEQIVTTDTQGNYRVRLRGGTHTNVFIDRPGRIVGTTNVLTGTDDVIEMHETLPPAVVAKPRKRPDLIPPYSDAAIEADTWTRAWLLLHVNERGVVTHIKLLKSPGHDLDGVALRAAFALRFDPAQDLAKRAIRSLVVWTFEWPAYWWMRRGNYAMSRLPGAVAKVPCRRADRPRGWDRDCAKPDIARSHARRWLAHERP